MPQVRADAARQRADRHRHESAQPSLEDGPSSVPAEPIGLFDASGRVVLPDIAPSAPADPFEANRQMPEFAASPLDHPAALAYRSTRFNRRWVPDGETLGGTFVRKATFEKHWDTRGGNRIQCVIVVIFPACLWGWIPRVPIEELKAMRADPPLPRQR